MAFNWEPFSYHPELYEKIAVLAEEMGLDSFFVSDHFLRPHLGIEPHLIKRHATIEAYSLLSYIAAKTSTIKLGTCVTPLTMRNPAQLAKIVSTLDNLSEGRFIFGAGTGYYDKEFEAYSPYDLHRRVARSIEAVKLIKRLWTEDVVDFTGEFFSVKGAVLEPKPVQKPNPPIWFGALHERMFRVTAELGEGWMPAPSLGATPEFYEKNSKLIRSMAKPGKKITMSLMGYVVEDPSISPMPPLGTASEIGKAIEQYRSAGCVHVAVAFLPVEKYLDSLKRFCIEIVPSFS